MTDLGGRRSDLWDAAVLDRLAELWGKTDLTVKVIAAELGAEYTKGAVIGKIHRTPSIRMLRPIVRKGRPYKKKVVKGEGAMEVSQVLVAPACDPIPPPDVVVDDPGSSTPNGERPEVSLENAVIAILHASPDGLAEYEIIGRLETNFGFVFTETIDAPHEPPPAPEKEADPPPGPPRAKRILGGAAALERARTATAKIKAKPAPSRKLAASEPGNASAPLRRINPEDFIATAPPTVKDFDPPRADGLLSIWQLTDSSCHWPVGDPLTPSFGYCGKPKPFGPKQPYCEDHQARAETPKATWLRRNAA